MYCVYFLKWQNSKKFRRRSPPTKYETELSRKKPLDLLTKVFQTSYVLINTVTKDKHGPKWKKSGSSFILYNFHCDEHNNHLVATQRPRICYGHQRSQVLILGGIKCISCFVIIMRFAQKPLMKN